MVKEVTDHMMIGVVRAAYYEWGKLPLCSPDSSSSEASKRRKIQDAVARTGVR